MVVGLPSGKVHIKILCNWTVMCSIFVRIPQYSCVVLKVLRSFSFMSYFSPDAAQRGCWAAFPCAPVRGGLNSKLTTAHVDTSVVVSGIAKTDTQLKVSPRFAPPVYLSLAYTFLPVHLLYIVRAEKHTSKYTDTRGTVPPLTHDELVPSSRVR